MRVLRAIVLLGAGVAIAMAFMAATAAAQETAIEASEGGTGHCDPCVLHLVGVDDTQLTSHAFGAESVTSTCREELTFEIATDGSGAIVDQGMGPPVGGGSCTVQACDSATESDWSVTAADETATGVSDSTVRVCIETAGGGTEIHCNATVRTAREAPADGHEAMAIDQHCPVLTGFELEYAANWETEGAPIDTDHLGEGGDLPIEVSDDQGAHCDPCPAHLVSTQDTAIVSHIFGSESLASTCREELSAELHEDGTGHVTDQQLRSAPTGTCTNQACETTPGTKNPWPIVGPAETGPGTSHITIVACYEPVGGGTERTCGLEVQVLREDPRDGHEVLAFNQHCPIFAGVESEVAGQWETEGTPIEVAHPDPGPPSPVEVSERPPHCDPCGAHLVSTVDTQIVSHVFGAESVASRCREELTLELEEDATGRMTDQDLDPPTGGGTCTNQACQTTPGVPRPWPITVPGETGPGTSHFTVAMCLEPVGGGTERTCALEVQVLREGPRDHHEILGFNQHCALISGVESEFSGQWETEGTPIEITHLGS